MKKKFRFVSVFFWSVILIIILVTAEKVSAEESPTYTVQLTAEQTLALYGQSFNALYYNGSSQQNVTFVFDKSTRQICDELNDIFTTYTIDNTQYSLLPDGAKNAFTMYGVDEINWTRVTQTFNNCLLGNNVWIGANNGSIIDREKLIGYEFLLYRCDGVSPRPVNSNSYDFQFNIPFSISISGVEQFKSLYMFQIGMFSASNAFQNTSVVIPNGNLRSEIRLYGINQLVPLDVTSDTFYWGNGTDTSKFGLSMHPINSAGMDYVTPSVPTMQVLDRWTSQFGIFSMCVMDSVLNSAEITGLNWNIRAGDAQFKFLKQGFDPLYSHISDPNAANYQYQDDCIYLMIMCPIIQGDYHINRPGGSGTIDYTEQIDKLVSGSDATNNKLDIIIQKLNQIYNQMVADNGGVDLVAPEIIGFTQQQKQQILDGVNSLDSAMDDLSPEDLPTETIGGFFDIWDNITSAIPPGLMALYIFALVGGIASWVIFSGRGG